MQSCGCLEAKQAREARAKTKAEREIKLARDREKEASSKLAQMKVKRAIRAHVPKIWKEATMAGLSEEQIAEWFSESFESCRCESGKWISKLIDPGAVVKAVDRPGGATMAEIMDFICLPLKSRNHGYSLQIASILRAAGFNRWRIRRGIDAAGNRRYVPGWIGPRE